MECHANTVNFNFDSLFYNMSFNYKLSYSASRQLLQLYRCHCESKITLFSQMPKDSISFAY